MTNPSIKGPCYMPYPSGLATIGTRPAQSSQDAGLSFSPSSAPLPSNDAASVTSNQLVLYRRSVCRARNDENGACTLSAHRDKVCVVAGPAQRQFDEEQEKFLATEKELQFFRMQYAVAFQEKARLRECINACSNEPIDLCPSNSLLLSQL
ncbi:hypothetical protein BT96DRAFT_1005358 [Gymnopus androsaceus JB14]|uniref:Uncharacterized protein n=1 Tax=Gymnopus androsaceus JB14 TaxID=1447944 RepID=A0A6A4GN68_9AGAR|nr:hypothetical protein BT96DRAFT_1005358 [Gymnopus androsaceus JB14]